MTVWFTVQLEDRPGSLARVATALGERGVNITGIIGVAEDTGGALMLTTSDAATTAWRSRPLACPTRSTTRPAASCPTGSPTSGAVSPTVASTSPADRRRR